MKTVLVFDIDSTLTPPRQPINVEMTGVLSRLTVPFHVAAGSHLTLLEDQFFIPLYEHGYRGVFDAFVSNGAIRYHCDYTSGRSVELVSAFVIKDHLGPEGYTLLLETLEKALSMPEFALPGDIDIVEGRIVDRSSMVNFCPMGRLQKEDQGARKNRETFVRFDKQTGYRARVMGYLFERLDSLVKDKGLHITLGGQTSFDIGIWGEDKTKPIRLLIADGYDNVVFIGDALFPGGNDAAIREYIEAWPQGSSCPAEAIQVESWRDTVSIIQRRNYIK